MIRSVFSSISNPNPNSSLGKASQAIAEASKAPTFFERITRVVREKCVNMVTEQQYYSPSNKSYCDKSYIKALKSKNEKNNIVKLEEDNHKSSLEVRRAL